MKRISLAVTALFISLLPLSILAEEALRGRLPDGRAFRTDSQGVQIVDYIAELELTIEALNRRIQGLESELNEKQGKLDRVARGGSADSQLVERDLLGADSANQPAYRACPRCPQTADQGLENKVQQLSAEIDQLLNQNRQLALQNEQFTTQNAQLLSQKKQFEVQQSEFQTQQNRSQSCSQQNEKMQQQLLQQQQELAAYKNEVATLRTALHNRELAFQQMAKEKEVQKASYREQPAVRTITASPVAVSSRRQVDRQPVVRAQYSPERMRAMGAVRSSIKSDLNRLRGLVERRNAKYKSYKKSGAAVQFNLSPLISSRNKSLSAVSQKLASAKTMRELSLLQKDVREIKAKVQDDLALINRLSKRG